VSDAPDRFETDENRVVIRRMSESDITAVFQILKESAGAASWSLDAITKTVPGGPVWIAEKVPERLAASGQNTCGVLIGQIAADEFEILNLAVGRGDRRRGIGSRLVEAAVAFAFSNGGKKIYLEVRASNDSAIAFYHRLGFRECGRRREYYRLPQEDAVLLSRELA
jgi:ribosomal-protein-alanine N-acetyltransferase